MDTPDLKEENRTLIHDAGDSVVEASTESKDGVDFVPGSIVGGRYKIISLLGRGGMGAVYKVEQIFLNQEYALKTVKESQFSENTLRRFQKEAQAIGKLNHPNIVKAHDFGIIDETHPYMVMDLVEGESLSERIKRDGAIGEQEALNIFIPVCFAIGYAHEQGVIHRDLKPSNIVLSPGDDDQNSIKPKVVDFGLAKMTSADNNAPSLTNTGDIFGTPYYMSPEQCKGEGVDRRSDIYSLGCVFFEALTSSPPFPGTNAISTLTQHLSEKAPSLREASLGRRFSPGIERIVAKMLDKDPSERYQNMEAVARDLMALKGAPDVVQSSGNIKAPSAQPRRIAPVSFGLTEQAAALPFALGIFVGLISGGIIAMSVMGSHAPTPPESTPEESAKVMHQVPPRSYRKEPFSQLRKDDAGREYRIYQFEDNESRWLEIKSEHSRSRRVGKLLTVTCPDRYRTLCINTESEYIQPQELRWFSGDDISTVKIKSEEDWLAGAQQESNEDVESRAQKLDELISQIPLLASVERLHLNKVHITDDELRKVERLPRLAELELERTNVTAKGLIKSKVLTKLKQLSVCEMKGIVPVVQFISKNRNRLNELTVKDSSVTDHEVKEICQLKHLSMLGLTANEHITNASIPYICSLPELRHLFIEGTRISDQGIAELTKLKTLYTLRLGSYQLTPEAIKLIAQAPQLKVLIVPDTEKYRVPELQRALPGIVIHTFDTRK